jgi:hypothetical protein
LTLLIDFAAQNGLAVTFQDVDDWRYISKADSAFKPVTRYLSYDTSPPQVKTKAEARFPNWHGNKEAFAITVRQFIQTKSLWKNNTERNQVGPGPGDLMMIFETGAGGRVTENHTALVYRVYPPGRSHVKWNDYSVPNFPGPDAAKADFNQTEYFKGTVFQGSQVTISRMPDTDTHFDYLNSRADAKRNAELIYFSNAWQAVNQDGFEFRKYSSNVTDNWFDWKDGEAFPPR